MARGHSLLAYTLTRIALAVPMLLILLTAVFVILRILPGDPILALWGGRTPPPDVVENARHVLGLDQPAPVQYVNYLTNICTGNLGVSIGELYRGQPVWNQIAVRLPATIELAIGSMIIASTVGIVTGVVAGAHPGPWVDVTVRLWGTVIWVMPIFWLGLLFQLVFGVGLGWFPTSGRWTGTDVPPTITGLYTVDSLLEGNFAHFLKALSHLVLPCLTLGLVLSGFFTKTVRANMLRTITADYSDAARARGVPERRVVYRHAFKNALVPVVTVLGLQFAILFAGAVLTERTFSWDGMGTLLLDSINSKDYPMIQGTIIVYAFIIIVISVSIDIVNGLIDPRVRY